jgi:hypothetical protein
LTTRLPPDRGLPALGLLMQAVGTFFALASLILATPRIIEVIRAVELGVSLDHTAVVVPVLLVLGAVRSMFHRQAGVALVEGKPPPRALAPYAIAAAVHTAAWGIGLILLLDTPLAATVPILLVSASWPATLIVALSQPALRPVDAPRGGDDLEGLGVLMLVFGMCGALFIATTLGMFVSSLDANANVLLTTLAAGVILVCLPRSAIHVHGAIVLLRGATIDAARSAGRRYVWFGLGSSALVCVGLAIAVVVDDDGRAVVRPLIVGLLVFLASWPISVRHFLRARPWTPPGEPPVALPRARDRGLSTLGWILLGLGVSTLAFGAPGALMPPDRDHAITAAEMTDYLAMFQPQTGVSPWWGIAGAAVQAWAGVELVFMTTRYRRIALAYGLSAVVLAILACFALMEMLRTAGNLATTVRMIGVTIALSLVIPLITVVLVLRRPVPEPPPIEVFD